MSQSNYDSDFCGSLPIHLTNSIQPHGILAVIDKTSHHIIQISENAAQVFQRDIPSIVNTSINDYVSLAEQSFGSKNIFNLTDDKIPVTWTIAGKPYTVLLHLKEEYYLAEIEIEPVQSASHSFVNVFQEVKYAIARIESRTTVDDVCFEAAKELKRISGFDKIMIYSFDDLWNGTVITEVMEEGMESYIGYTFPASDIPKQARQLYERNPYRLIPTREYKPVKLYPVINPSTHSFIDLSSCNLRSVATVHLEYLKNMGVNASMSTRILKDERLWGLIACHHRAPKYLNYETCSVFEMLSNIISAKISSLLNKQSHAFDTVLKEKYTALVERAYKSQDIEESLLNGKPDLLELFNASGAVITSRRKYFEAGVVPSRSALEDLVLWLHTRQLREVFYTESLESQYDMAANFHESASGALVIPINAMEDEYIILLRPEVIRVIHWGGNPDDRIRFESDGKNYHPRNSFALWRQQVTGTSHPWKKEEIHMAEKLRAFIFEYLSAQTAMKRASS